MLEKISYIKKINVQQITSAFYRHVSRGHRALRTSSRDLSYKLSIAYGDDFPTAYKTIAKTPQQTNVRNSDTENPKLGRHFSPAPCKAANRSIIKFAPMIAAVHSSVEGLN